MQERTLVFPEDVSVGRLSARHGDAWLPEVPARGRRTADARPAPARGLTFHYPFTPEDGS